jgi:hypothetical protein
MEDKELRGQNPGWATLKDSEAASRIEVEKAVSHVSNIGWRKKGAKKSV